VLQFNQIVIEDDHKTVFAFATPLSQLADVIFRGKLIVWAIFTPEQYEVDYIAAFLRLCYVQHPHTRYIAGDFEAHNHKDDLDGRIFSTTPPFMEQKDSSSIRATREATCLMPTTILC
jgi:hypothetical protein